jgi:hypothetical protein
MDADEMEKRRKIFLESMEGKCLLETLKSGNDVYEPEVAEKRFMQLLYFRQYTQMYEFAFNDWDTDGLEQTYIEVANEAMALHELFHHPVFKETLLRLLRVLSDKTGKSPVQIHEEYMELLREEWIAAGLIRRL